MLRNVGQKAHSLPLSHYRLQGDNMAQGTMPSKGEGVRGVYATGSILELLLPIST